MSYLQSNYAYFGDKASEMINASLDASIVSLQDYIKNILDLEKRPSEQSRRQRYADRRRVMDDDWKVLLQDRLRGLMHPRVYEALAGANCEYVDTCMNPARDIWRELGSVLYSVSPVRRMANPDDNELYQRSIAGTSYNSFWRNVDVASEAFNNVVLMPTVTFRNGEPIIKHRWYTGDNVMVITYDTDPTEVESLILIDHGTSITGKPYKNYILFHDAWHVMFNDRGDMVSEGDGTNPLGIIPAVHVRLTSMTTKYWDDTSGSDLVEQTLSVGQQRTLTNYLWRMSSHKQLVITGDGVTSANDAGEQLLDPCAVIDIDTGGSGSAQLLDWQVDFKSRRDWINDDIASAISSRGINPRRMQREVYQVGEAAKMYDRGLAERARAKMEIFREAEKEYTKILGLLLNYYGVDSAYNPDAELQIEYQRYEYPQDPSDLLDYYTKAIDLNVENIETAIQKLHPEWDSEKVHEVYLDNVQKNISLAEEKAKRNVASQILTESLTSQQNGAMGPMARDLKKKLNNGEISTGTSTGTTNDDKKES